MILFRLIAKHHSLFYSNIWDVFWAKNHFSYSLKLFPFVAATDDSFRSQSQLFHNDGSDDSAAPLSSSRREIPAAIRQKMLFVKEAISIGGKS